MRELVWPVAALICLGACASTPPPATSAAGTQAAPSTGGDSTDNSRPASEPDSADARDDSDSVIAVAEVPTVQAQPVRTEPPKPICRRIKPTGSHRTQRVCYMQAESDTSTAGAREVFGELHRQQQLPRDP